MPPQSEQVSVIDQEDTKQSGLKITSGIRKYPSNRNDKLKDPAVWLNGKKKDDAVHPYWRVHDKLYDVTSFVKIHPGGEFWLEATQGTDITESFESSHFGPSARAVLKKYYVKDIHTPRNSPFTFHENGFYKTLQRKVTPILKKVGTGPSRSMCLIQDSLLAGFIIFGAMAALNLSVFYAAISGIFMCLMANVSHNFFHQRDNWRMHIFDLTLTSTRDWRISHVLSHHNFPNTILDYEVSSIEPHLELLPKSNKSFVHRYVVVVTGSLLYVLAFYFAIVYKFILNRKGETKYYKEHALPFVHLLAQIALTGSLYEGIRIWLIINTIGNYLFMMIGLTAGHHDPDIYHEGDRSSDEKDWGLHQVSATRERGEWFVKSLFLASTTFGNHTLHHLFPTVDHSKLVYLQEAFLETCQEFNIKFKISTPWKLFIGYFKQLAANKPNPNLPSIFK